MYVLENLVPIIMNTVITKVYQNIRDVIYYKKIILNQKSLIQSKVVLSKKNYEINSTIIANPYDTILR